MSYSGLTIVLSNPSRFDTEISLLNGAAGNAFKAFLRPLTVAMCDVRLEKDKTPYLPGTKVVLHLGKPYRDDLTLSQQRGYPYVDGDVIHLCSYFPQDCMDMKNYEKDYNKNRDIYADDDDESESEYDTKSNKGATRRNNYIFWLQQDVRKAIRYLNEGITVHPQPKYVIPPFEAELEKFFSNPPDEIGLDIETDSQMNLTCIGFGTKEVIYVIPFKTYENKLFYSELFYAKLFRWLTLYRGTVVAHNGMFDWWVLCVRYRIPFGKKLFDTMLAHARCHVDVEKSLGHCISLYTDLPYHKNEGVFNPKNHQQDEQLWEYNGKDVYSTLLVKDGIAEYASKHRGIPESIKQVSDMIYPYLLCGILGMRVDNKFITEIKSHNDRRMMQLLRIMRLAIGDNNFLPGSAKQCVAYFHHRCGIPVIARSGKTGAPSLGAKQLLKLAITSHHPLIPWILEYRALAKQTGSLKYKQFQLPDYSKGEVISI